ncbi:putative aspartic protease At2g35615 [Silene latifolia]|uniref:putative aspartic protease At2g35615 n=1 Tax=Silene latifolia TaxID=37657 RepID=UPI003D77D742
MHSSTKENNSLKMLTLLFYFFTALSYHHKTVTGAKTQQEDGFTVNLMHRYSQKSPFYDPYMSSLERFQKLLKASKSRHDQIKSLQNKVDTTILTNDGDYLMSLYVGTPPTELVAVLDTSIDLTWLQCTPCVNCYEQTVPLFKPYSSKTYKILPCDSQHCSDLDPSHINCDQSSDQCLYWYTFGNHTSMTGGVMGNDTFSFSSSDRENPSFPSTTFGCGYDQVGEFDQRSAGVVSLGSGPLSLVSQMGYKIDYKFSYCLASTSNSTSKLRFGASETIGQETVRTPFFTKYPASFYNLELYSISIGQVSVKVNNEIILDTASTLTYLTPSIFSTLVTMVNGAIRIKPIVNGLVESVLCYTTPSGVIIPPDMVFHFSGGDLVLKGTNLFFEYNDSLCMSIVSTLEEDDPLVFGNMAQVNLEVQYDLLRRTVSFSPKDCALDK